MATLPEELDEIGIVREEGTRTVRTADNAAYARYSIAELQDGRYAVTVSVGYRCGDYHGAGWGWHVHETREACVADFLNKARRHFWRELKGSLAGENQHRAQREMQGLLEDGLFGFMEPNPEEFGT